MRSLVVVAFLLACGAVQAAGFPSYLPLPGPVKIKGDVEVESYGQAEFALRGKAEVIRGKTWRGTVDATGLGAGDKQYFAPLAEAFVKAGWEVMLRDEPSNPPIATFKRVREGRELWASTEGSAEALRVVVVEQGAPSARLQLEAPAEGIARVADTADFPFLKRFPGAKGPVTQKEGAMLVAESGRAPAQVAASSVRKEYVLAAGASALEVIVVYRDALKAAGWRIVDENTGVKTADPNLTAQYAKGALELWAHVHVRGERFTVTVGAS